MNKKILIITLSLYLIIGIYFYWSEVKYGRNVWICPNEGFPSSITKEPLSADCKQPQYSLDKREFQHATIMITLWLPLLIGHMYAEPSSLNVQPTTVDRK